MVLQHKTKTQNGHIKSIEGRDLELIIYLEKDLESAWQDDFKKRGKNITKEDYCRLCKIWGVGIRNTYTTMDNRQY